MANYQTCKSGRGSCGILNYGAGPPQRHLSTLDPPEPLQTPAAPTPPSPPALVPPDRQMDQRQRLKQWEERSDEEDWVAWLVVASGWSGYMWISEGGYYLFLDSIKVSV